MSNEGKYITTQNNEYCENLDQTIISITEDKLKNILLENDIVLKTKMSWTTPLGLFLTCFITLVTSSFRDTLGFSAAVWTAFFLLGAISTFFWMLTCCYKAYKNRNQGDIKSLIEKIKAKDKHE